MSLSVTALKSAKIAALNDALRKTFMDGKIMMTAGINALPDRTKAVVMTAVCNFSNFNEDNDPHGEHDFGSVEIEDTKFFWKIDYYDKSLDGGSTNPADPAATTRVLTIMLASEY